MSSDNLYFHQFNSNGCNLSLFKFNSPGLCTASSLLQIQGLVALLISELRCFQLTSLSGQVNCKLLPVLGHSSFFSLQVSRDNLSNCEAVIPTQAS